jgi:hypothetical protein
MKQVFVLNAAEQAALARGQAQIMRLSDGAEFEFRFDLAHVNGRRRQTTAENAREIARQVMERFEARRARAKARNARYRARQRAKNDARERLAGVEMLKCPQCTLHFVGGLAMHQHLRLAHKLSRAARRKLFPLKRENVKAAVTLGRLGGKKTSAAKARAARENGRRGGRPRQSPEERSA